MSYPEINLIINEIDVISEVWTYGHYEVDNHHADRESGGFLVLSEQRFLTEDAVKLHMQDNLSNSEWMYDVFRIINVAFYEIKVKTT